MSRIVVTRPGADGRTDVVFWCPGCRHTHSVPTGEGPRPTWAWDGNRTAPTITPSILNFYDLDGVRKVQCHHFVTAGRIRYCSDSAHNLAGQTVPMVPIPDDYHVHGADGDE